MTLHVNEICTENGPQRQSHFSIPEGGPTESSTAVTHRAQAHGPHILFLSTNAATSPENGFIF